MCCKLDIPLFENPIIWKGLAKAPKLTIGAQTKPHGQLSKSGLLQGSDLTQSFFPRAHLHNSQVKEVWQKSKTLWRAGLLTTLSSQRALVREETKKLMVSLTAKFQNCSPSQIWTLGFNRSLSSDHQFVELYRNSTISIQLDWEDLPKEMAENILVQVYEACYIKPKKRLKTGTADKGAST